MNLINSAEEPVVLFVKFVSKGVVSVTCSAITPYKLKCSRIAETKPVVKLTVTLFYDK